MKFPTLIERFIDPWGFLSNFYGCKVTYEDEDYPSVEHAYQAAKTLDKKKRMVFQFPGLKPGKAKELGSKLVLRPDWEEVKVGIMRELLIQKFYGTVLRRKLLCTGAAQLIEGNYWHDEFWGVCDGTCKRGPHEPNGLNWLGILLMEVRVFYGGLKAA